MRYRYGRGNGPFGLSAVTSLIVINVFVFLLAFILDQFIDVYDIFGLKPFGFSSRPWTIATAMFLHADIMHIFTNMLTLYFFGDFVVELVGERRFLWIYLLGGITGNIFYVVLAQSNVPAVGASGAIFALGGVLTLMRPMVRVIVFPIPAPIPLWIAVIGGFLLLSFIPGIAWQAHFGGLLSGLIAGYFLRRRERRIY